MWSSTRENAVDRPSGRARAVDFDQIHDLRPKLWALDGRHAQLLVERVELRLRRLYITPQTRGLVKAIKSARTPVRCTHLSIHPAMIEGGRGVVQAFVEGLGPEEELYVETATPLHPRALGNEDQNDTDRIRIVTDTMANFDPRATVVFGGLLKLYRTHQNRETIWQALFESVLSPESPPRDLSFDQDVALASEDAPVIRLCASRWREANPGKKLCFRKLHLALMGSYSDAVAAILSVLDDAEHVQIEDNCSFPMQSPQVLLSALRFPSLENVVVESMDVFDPSIPDLRLPTKPVLEVLGLSNVVVRDRESSSVHHQALSFLRPAKPDVDKAPIPRSRPEEPSTPARYLTET